MFISDAILSADSTIISNTLTYLLLNLKTYCNRWSTSMCVIYKSSTALWILYTHL